MCTFFKRWNFVKFSLYFPYIVVRMWHLSYSYTAVVFSSSGYCTKTSKIHNFWTDCLIFLKLSMMRSTNIAAFSQSLCIWRWTCPLKLQSYQCPLNQSCRNQFRQITIRSVLRAQWKILSEVLFLPHFIS